MPSFLTDVVATANYLAGLGLSCTKHWPAAAGASTRFGERYDFDLEDFGGRHLAIQRLKACTCGGFLMSWEYYGSFGKFVLATDDVDLDQVVSTGLHDLVTFDDVEL